MSMATSSGVAPLLPPPPRGEEAGLFALWRGDGMFLSGAAGAGQSVAARAGGRRGGEFAPVC